METLPEHSKCRVGILLIMLLSHIFSLVLVKLKPSIIQSLAPGSLYFCFCKIDGSMPKRAPPRFNIFNQKSHEFEFRPGPVFSDILLADEINRATPRTQSALLESMAERQATIDTVRYPLAAEFFVIATQNPHEQHGTYPLPEAQLDRFAMKLNIGYPHRDDERLMLADAVVSASRQAAEHQCLFLPGQLARIQDRVAEIAVAESVQDYLVRLAEASRQHPEIVLGLSPRGLLTWQRMAQAWAYLDGRSFITPNDVQDVAMPVLIVRLGIERDDAKPVIEGLLNRVQVPTGV